jgi:hypothetical protein
LVKNYTDASAKVKGFAAPGGVPKKAMPGKSVKKQIVTSLANNWRGDGTVRSPTG